PAQLSAGDGATCRATGVHVRGRVDAVGPGDRAWHSVSAAGSGLQPPGLHQIRPGGNGGAPVGWSGMDLATAPAGSTCRRGVLRHRSPNGLPLSPGSGWLRQAVPRGPGMDPPRGWHSGGHWLPDRLLDHVLRIDGTVDPTPCDCPRLLREHGVKWSNDRLRAALTGFRQALLPFVAGLQKARLLTWLRQAEQARGRHRPVLAVGRDGIMIPMRSAGYEEASTATVSVYDRRRRRLGTIYLGQMPQAKQVTLSDLLTQLLSSTLADWHGPLPRLAYITDKGSAPDEYYQRVLKKMRHPRAGQPLAWEWVLDFYHVCSYIGKLADALFGMATQAGAQWFAKMRRWLRDRPQGAAQVIRSAMQHLDRRPMTKAQKAAFWKAYRYVRRHRRWMDYAGYRRRGLPIGSGVTEAACKTVFTQRFKRSGMRWHHESGQVILDLRTIYLSGIWEEAFAADLAARE